MLAEKDFPANLPKEYRKCYEELHELLNLIFFTLKEVKEEGWRRKLAEMCVLVLGAGLFEINGGEKPIENYIRCSYIFKDSF